MASIQYRSPPKVRLENSPSGEEEAEAFGDLVEARGDSFDEEKAKIRVDKIARRLALAWTIFLWYIIFAQGQKNGANLSFWPYWPVQPKFHLAEGEFIAVVTTTTASVFGFLVIVARHLFRQK